MPQGSPFEFEPGQEKGDPSKGRATYGDDVRRTIPFINDDRKPTNDPFIIKQPDRPTEQPDRGNPQTATPGLFPDRSFTETHADKLGPGGIIDQQNQTALERQYAEIRQTMDGRNRTKGNDPLHTVLITSAGTPLALGGIQQGIVDPYMKGLQDTKKMSPAMEERVKWYNRSHNHLTAESSGQWFSRNYSQRDAITAVDDKIDNALMSTERILTEQAQIRANIDAEAAAKAAGKTVKNPEARVLMQDSELLKLGRTQEVLGKARSVTNQATLAELGDDAFAHSSLNLKGKTWSTAGGTAKIDGDDIIKILDDKASSVKNLSREANKFSVADDVALGKSSIATRTKLALTGGALLIGDDSIRGTINSVTGSTIPTDIDHKTGISGIAIPAALSMHKPGGTKATMALTGLAMAGSMLIDSTAKDSGALKYIPDSVKRTSWEDGVAMGGALYTMPRVRGWKAKAATFAAFYTAGNLADSMFGDSARKDLDVPMSAAMRTMDTLGADRNFNNMKLAVHSWNKVGERSIGAEGAVWAEFQAKDNYTPTNPDRTQKWNSLSGPEKLDNRIDMAVLARSLGELRLEGGKRIGQKNGEGFYVLKDNKIDLGGYALEKLLISKVETGEAIKLTKDPNINGEMLNGKTINMVTDVPQLELFQRDTSQKIRGITNTAHDMTKLKADLMHLETKELGIDTYRKEVLQDTQNRIGQFQGMAFQTEEGRQLVAKLLRDEAIIRMASAEIAMENGNGIKAGITLMGTDEGEREPFPNIMKDSSGKIMQKGYDGVRGALLMSQMLDPTNPDLRQLIDMYNGMLRRQPDVVMQQIGNSRKNPLNVDNGLYRR